MFDAFLFSTLGGASMFKSAKANKISEHISDQIRRAIFGGELKPGDRLPPDKELMEAFEVGKATLRERIRALETLRFLQVRKGASGGAFFTEVNIKTARECLSNFLRFQHLSLIFPKSPARGKLHRGKSRPAHYAGGFEKIRRTEQRI